MPQRTTRPDDTVHFETPRKRRRRRSSVMTVNLTPAIDITFNLLIFFLVATTFKAAEGILPTELPREQGVLEATPLPISPIKIRIGQVGDGPGDYTIRLENWRRQPITFVDLTAQLEAIIEKPGFDQDTPVILLPDRNVQWDHVVNCFNAVRRVNLHKGPDQTLKNISFIGRP